MKEQQKHRDAYEYYRDMPATEGKRSIAKVAKKFSVSETSVNKWNKAFQWQQRVMLHDQEVQKGLQEKMMPEWVETKAYLLKVALEQVKKGRDAGVSPASTRDMMAAIKEARSMMGETDTVQVNAEVKHEISINETMKEYDTLLTTISSRNQDQDDHADDSE